MGFCAGSIALSFPLTPGAIPDGPSCLAVLQGREQDPGSGRRKTAGFRAHGDIRRPDALECEMRRCRIECAIWLASEGLYESHGDSREAEPAE